MTKAFSISRAQDGARCVKRRQLEEVLLREERPTGKKTLMAQSLTPGPNCRQPQQVPAEPFVALRYYALLLNTYSMLSCYYAHAHCGQTSRRPCQPTNSEVAQKAAKHAGCTAIHAPA
jgi:hypothetical protein